MVDRAGSPQTTAPPTAQPPCVLTGWIAAAEAAGGSSGGGGSLAVALARERLHPSTEAMRLYVASLPRECPHNLATRPASDLELASASLHHWKVEL